MIAFCVTIISYTWRSGATNDGPRGQLTPEQALGVRIAISAVFGTGLVYFVLILRTFGRYAQSGFDKRPRTRRRNAGNGEATGAGHAPTTDARADERARERGRDHRNLQNDERERDVKSALGSMVGLGLTGLDVNGVGSPGTGSLSGVVVTTREVESEKGDFLAGEKGRGRGRISPRL